MTNNILESIRELNWVQKNYSNFDGQLIPKINAALMILNQIGIGVNGFRIETGDETWDEFLSGSEASVGIGGIQEYVGQKVRQMFDPPQGAAGEANKAIIAELEWRLNVAVDPDTTFD